MTGAAPQHASTWDLAPVGLAQVGATADLQVRHERKYLVPGSLVDRLVAELNPALQILEIEGERSFRYESVYFDTADLVAYRATAHRRRRRFKVRTRAYLDTEICAVEVKIRDGRGRTVKHRLEYPFGDRNRLSDTGLRFIAGFTDTEPFVNDLEKTLTTRYHRSTLLVSPNASRVTIDTDVSCSDSNGRVTIRNPLALIEVKTAKGPEAVDRWLWANGHRPDKISKYGTGLAALRADLPANKWSRTLRRHFERGPAGDQRFNLAGQ